MAALWGPGGGDAAAAALDSTLGSCEAAHSAAGYCSRLMPVDEPDFPGARSRDSSELSVLGPGEQLAEDQQVIVGHIHASVASSCLPLPPPTLVAAGEKDLEKRASRVLWLFGRGNRKLIGQRLDDTSGLVLVWHTDVQQPRVALLISFGMTVFLGNEQAPKQQ